MKNLTTDKIIEFLDKYPIKTPLCFDQGEHECHDLADAILHELIKGEL